MIIRYDDRDYECDEEYCYKDFTGRDLSHSVIRDNVVIYASCFSQETPDSRTLPASLSGVIFLNCNLDNVFVPPGNTVRGGSQKRFKVQNDLRDWEIDADNRPTELINEKYWQTAGYSTDPIDIPESPLRKPEELKPQPLDVSEVQISDDDLLLLKKIKKVNQDSTDVLKKLIPEGL